MQLSLQITLLPEYKSLNSLPNDKILEYSKFKVLEDDIISAIQKLKLPVG